jgi:hypothetical protein
MSIALPDWTTPPTRWPWLARILTARRLLVLALFLGLLSFAAVVELTIQCRDKPNYILATNGGRIMLADGSGFLLLAEKSRVCRLALGNAFAIKRTKVTQNRA